MQLFTHTILTIVKTFDALFRNNLYVFLQQCAPLITFTNYTVVVSVMCITSTLPVSINQNLPYASWCLMIYVFSYDSFVTPNMFMMRVSQTCKK